MQSTTDATQYKAASDHCHDRFCRPCCVARSRTVAANVRELLADKPARHLTLTIRHTDKPLSDQLDHLYQSYRRLRQRKLWKDRVDAAAAMLELTYNRDTGQWHPHLHCVLAGRYLPVEPLRNAWLNVTGDSKIVDIRYVSNANRTANYVAKYATKAIDADVIACKHALVQAIEALRGRRSIVATGQWAHAHLTRPPKDTQWTTLCHVAELWSTPKLPDRIRQPIADWLDQLARGIARPIATIAEAAAQPQEPDT